VNERTRARDVINETGPAGNFLGHKHTFKNFKKELLHSNVFDHNNWEKWVDNGSKDIHQVAIEKVRILMDKEQEPMLSKEIEAGIDAIVEAATRDMAKK
jgi:trimethylamine--corrinoid protein Co-methyltransferase